MSRGREGEGVLGINRDKSRSGGKVGPERKMSKVKLQAGPSSCSQGREGVGGLECRSRGHLWCWWYGVR